MRPHGPRSLRLPHRGKDSEQPRADHASGTTVDQRDAGISGDWPACPPPAEGNDQATTDSGMQGSAQGLANVAAPLAEGSDQATNEQGMQGSSEGLSEGAQGLVTRPVTLAQHQTQARRSHGEVGGKGELLKAGEGEPVEACQGGNEQAGGERVLVPDRSHRSVPPPLTSPLDAHPTQSRARWRGGGWQSSTG